MAFELKITADTAMELIASVDAFHDAIAGRKPSVAEPATIVEEAPKASTSTRGRKKADGAPENGTVSEPTSPSEKPTLIADESTSVEQPPVEEKPVTSADASQEDKDALLKEATTFSQAHGHDALLAALKAVGAERFSAITFDKYPAFRAAMAKAGDAASALS